MLKILFIPSCPIDKKYSSLNIREELLSFEKVFAKSNIEAKIVPPLYGRIEEQLSKDDFNVVHYIGHGEKNGNLVLEDEVWEANLVKPQEFCAWFKGKSTELMLVVIECCYSYQVSKLLYEQGIAPFVVGIEGKIYDEAAFNFSKHFYQFLADGDGITDAFEKAKTALSETRRINVDFAKVAGKINLWCEEGSNPGIVKFLEKRIFPPTNLRKIGSTQIIGRKEEQKDLHNEIQTNSLVTLYGLHGTGKKILAKSVAQRCLIRNEYSAGVYWINLSGVDKSKTFLYKLATELKLSEELLKKSNYEEFIGQEVKGERLLILTNLEQILARRQEREIFCE